MAKKIDFDDLKRRVRDFNLNRLPGQPLATHMGTSYLVNDLWRAVKELRDQAKENKGCEKQHIALWIPLSTR